MCFRSVPADTLKVETNWAKAPVEEILLKKFQDTCHQN